MYTTVIMVIRTAKMIMVCKYEAMNVAFNPPAEVYRMTPQGIKKLANSYCDIDMYL
jgi:hypothetical protein